MRGQCVKRVSAKGEVNYLLRVYRGEVGGKRRYESKTVHTSSKKEAERRLREWIQEIEGGKYVSPAKMKVCDLLEEWLKNWAADPENLEATTSERYENALRLHVIPEIGHLTLAQTNTLVFGQLYDKLRTNGMSRSALGIIRAGCV